MGAGFFIGHKAAIWQAHQQTGLAIARIYKIAGAVARLRCRANHSIWRRCYLLISARQFSRNAKDADAAGSGSQCEAAARNQETERLPAAHPARQARALSRHMPARSPLCGMPGRRQIAGAAGRCVHSTRRGTQPPFRYARRLSSRADRARQRGWRDTLHPSSDGSKDGGHQQSPQLQRAASCHAPGWRRSAARTGGV